MNGWVRGCALLLTLSSLRPVFALDLHFSKFDEDEVQWQEAEVKLPDFPKDEDLLEFYVSAVTPNRFYVDGKSISSDADGVVRFTLVIKTAGGATNVSFEGIRCVTSETRLYATGSTGAWVRARTGAWRPIENKPINRQHAALNRDYFCPSMVPIGSAEEGRNALMRGKHPDAQ